jgi:serine O-acetyltransferase
MKMNIGGISMNMRLAVDNVGKKDNAPRLRELIRSDVKRHKSISVALTKLGFYTALLYRLSHHFSRRNWMLPARCLQFLSHVITGAEISHRAVIGPGLCLHHPTAVHIGPNIVIGKMANLCQCCTISTNLDTQEEGPVIGDYLWAGPGCAIMGPIRLGDRVRVGPNAALFKDVASEMIAFGNPARIMPKDAFSPTSKKKSAEGKCPPKQHLHRTNDR